MEIYSLQEAQEELNYTINYQSSLYKSVLEHVQVCVFNNKDQIIYSDKPISNLYLLIDGKAKISIAHEDGTNSIVYFIKPNELIGELTLINIETQAKDVIAIGKCLCLSVPMSIAKSRLLKDPDFLLEMSQYIGTKLIDRTWFNAKQQHYELKHRLAAYILLCECEGIYNERHTETAEYLAVSYRHLLYTFQQFREEELIKKVSNGYTFDKEGLEKLSTILL